MRPRLGFLGVGWIGHNRLEALAAADVADIVAVADTEAAAARAAAAEFGADAVEPDALFDAPDRLDGIVIATPSALHASQSIRALERGIAVFCQKPLARTAPECSAVLEAARARNLLVGVDLSYRHLSAVQPARDLVRSGGIGDVYAVDLVFHNAYGPDKAWFRDPALAGGGCVIDLGIHLIDLALWVLDFPQVGTITPRLFAHGQPLSSAAAVVEDYATVLVDLASGAVIHLTCSWFLHAGADAEISATFHGTAAAVAVANVDGSFYDFRSVVRHGTTAQVLAGPPDAWGGRAAIEWARRLGAGEGFDPAAEHFVTVAEALDRMYGR